MEHEKWMRLALEEAVLDKNEVPVGALIVKDGEVIAAAHNAREKGDPLAHAEMNAMRQAAQKLGTRRLSGCTLYVTLEPCPMCAGAIVMSGIDRVVFGAWDEKQGCCGSVYAIPQDTAFYHTARVTGGILEEECAGQLQAFFREKRG